MRRTKCGDRGSLTRISANNTPAKQTSMCQAPYCPYEDGSEKTDDDREDTDYDVDFVIEGE